MQSFQCYLLCWESNAADGYAFDWNVNPATIYDVRCSSESSCGPILLEDGVMNCFDYFSRYSLRSFCYSWTVACDRAAIPLATLAPYTWDNIPAVPSTTVICTLCGRRDCTWAKRERVLPVQIHRGRWNSRRRRHKSVTCCCWHWTGFRCRRVWWWEKTNF